MPKIYLTRRERFSAAHRLFQNELNDTENAQIYGQCSHPNWHGHNYELFVTVKGDVNPNIGFTLNLKTLSSIIKTHIIDKVDHRNLNLDVPFLEGKIPTTENLAIAIWDKLSPHIKELGAELYKVKVQETENNFIEYFGEL